VPKTIDRVPCVPFAEAFQRSDLTAAEVAERMGWTDIRHPSTKVKRHLGLKRSQNGCGNWRYRRDMPYELAAEFARALEVDPVEVGL
jgi:hypothetical protein